MSGIRASARHPGEGRTKASYASVEQPKARPFGAALRAFCALRACPAFAGMTSVWVLACLGFQIRRGMAAAEVVSRDIVPTSSKQPACNPGGLSKAISLGYFS
ncbi:hypothetical protein [Rhodanobacter sp. DHB23]|uniref:hypothetical protein n=1 Tax=Rhodanobacter sp. DHB23 TaxID=2775923 RepID=UPI0017870B46|nr:hypothetical protein [Rhodanobacter sp. DHB23]MBD8871475.1 hypothetical protein [Rhodanobacter sp. DHB23]